MASIPSDQLSPYPGSEPAASAPTIPRDQALTSANSARGPPTTSDLELWGRATVLKFFGGDTPFHPCSFIRGMLAGRYPRPVNVAGNAARWVRSSARPRVSACSTGATNRE